MDPYFNQGHDYTTDLNMNMYCNQGHVYTTKLNANPNVNQGQVTLQHNSIWTVVSINVMCTQKNSM